MRTRPGLLLIFLAAILATAAPGAEERFQTIEPAQIVVASWSLLQKAIPRQPGFAAGQWREFLEKTNLSQSFSYLPGGFPRKMIAEMIADRHTVSVAMGSEGALKGYIAARVPELSDAELAFAFNLFAQGDPVVSMPVKVVEISVPEEGK